MPTRRKKTSKKIEKDRNIQNHKDRALFQIQEEIEMYFNGQRKIHLNSFCRYISVLKIEKNSNG